MEDRDDAHFVGEAGAYLHKVYIRWLLQEAPSSVLEDLTIYGTNAVRCVTPKNSNATEAQVNKCHHYLEDDIRELARHHSRIIILACGSPACRAVFGESLIEATRHQGKTIGWLRHSPSMGDVGASQETIKTVAFATFNPVMLTPKKEPGLLHAVRDHLAYVLDYLEWGKIDQDIKKDFTPTRGLRQSPSGRILSIDIETYGYVEGYPPQTVFNPTKSEIVDGVPRGEQVLTVAAAWLEGEEYQTAYWIFPEDEEAFVEFLTSGRDGGCSLLGMNFAFDLSYLRAHSPELRAALNRQVWIGHGRMLDLSVANFLENEARNERSLKDLSPLLRVAKYDEDTSIREKDFRFPSKYDPRFIQYNILDVVAALECWRRLEKRALKKYPKTAKFSDTCLDLYSDSLWSVMEMDENGIPMDRDKLQALQDRLTIKMQWLERNIHGWYDGALTVRDKPKFKRAKKVEPEQRALRQRRRQLQMPPGPQKWTIQVCVDAIVAAGVTDDKRIVRTKMDAFSTQKENMHLLRGLLPPTAKESILLRAVEMYRDAQKMVGTYTEPLLTDPVKGLVDADIWQNGIPFQVPMAYPSWFIVPSHVKDDVGTIGGTQQGRVTCKNPAIQTCPGAIKACMKSRWEGGVLLSADLSQIELRIAALLSGDELMCAEYRKAKPDLHSETTVAAFGHDVKLKANYKKKWRQVGKTLNFLMLFDGQAKKFQATVRNDVSIELPLMECFQAIANFNKRYPGLRAWQEAIIATALRQGYLELGLSGDSRTFIATRKTVGPMRPKIVNILVQAYAAWVLKGAQRQIGDRFLADGLRSLVCANIYDALIIDVYPGEEASARRILAAILPCPEYYQRLQSYVGRTLPIDYEVEVLAGNSNA